MPRLPPPDWLPLSETENLIKQSTNADNKKIREAVQSAFRDDNIKTKGKCREHYRHDAHVILDGFYWNKAVVDWSSSSFQVKLGKKDAFEEIFPSNPPFHFKDILVYRPDILRWLEDTPASEAEAKNAKNPGGRPLKWDWEGALIELIRVANTPDGLPSDRGAQAEIERIMRDWFVASFDGAPSTSEIRERARRIMSKIIKDGN